MSVKNTQFNTKDSYNSQYVSGKYVGYNSQQLANATKAGVAEQTTSGGIVSEYTDPGPGNVYRAHVFTGSGTFIVKDPTITAVEWLMVGGGGAAGGN